jgi:hypothetical protein
MGSTKLTIIAALFISATAAEALAADSSPNPICPLPKEGLTAHDSDADARAISFDNEGFTYELDIYSGFAPEQAAAGAAFCIRYEVENNSRSDILLLHWALPGVTIEKLEPGEENRQSFVKTVGDARPTIGDTELGAFKSKTLKSKAYQGSDTAAVGTMLLHYVADVGDEAHPVQPPPGKAVSVPPGGALPTVGAEFSGSNARVRSTSSSSQDGKRFLFNIALYRNSSKFVSSMIAPFTFALIKAESPSEIPELLKEFSSVELPLEDNQFKESRPFPAAAISGPLYLIQQPITFLRGGSRVCFLSPAYSPVDIPPYLLECR